ncbi:hypothetical protein MSPP1_002230 [Malassezia sp. CBS 17886]|nr:hypothetical protein MSPP1_002230 [Malassezia sp. CBS 17886]
MPDERCTEERRQIDKLRADLAGAEMLRQQHSHYDAVAEKILVYPSRQEQEASLIALADQIESRRRESLGYENAADSSRTRLQGIVAQLHELQTEVRTALGHATDADGEYAGSVGASDDSQATAETRSADNGQKRGHESPRDADSGTERAATQSKRAKVKARGSSSDSQEAETGRRG